MRFYLIICNIFLSNILFCQQYTVENISTQEGLSNNSVQSVYKDSRGILWVGTAIGLSKIQNHKIQNLNTDDGLAHSSCWAIAEDENNNMWFGSYGGGITFFDGKKFTVFNEKNGLCNKNIRKLCSFKNQLFVGTDNGFSIIDINTKKIETFNLFGKEKLIKVMSFFNYNDDFYIVTFNRGIWKLDKKHNLSLFNLSLSSLSVIKSKDSIKLYNNNRIMCFSNNDFIEKKNSKLIKSGYIWDYAMTKIGCFVAEQDFGNPTGGVFKIIKNKLKNYNDNFNINSKQIWCLFYDNKFNQLYVGTSDKGLFIVDLNKEIAYTYFNNEDIKFILKIDSSKVFLTSSKVFLEIKNKIKEIKPSELIKFAEKFYQKKKKLLPSNYNDFQARKNKININSYEVYHQNLFISTTLGLYKISKQGVLMSFFPIGVKYFKMLGATELIGFRDYLPAIYYKDIKQPNNYKELDFKNKNNPRDISCSTSIGSSLYLTSYAKGLYKFEDKKSYSYLANQQWNEKELLTSCKNDKGQLIVASQRGDIYVIANSKKFQILKKIKNNEIKGTSINFLESYKDYIIVGTNLGLNFYRNGVTIFLDEKNGLKNKLLNSAYLIEDNLFLATTKGYYELNLNKILPPKKQTCILAITKLEVNYKSIFNKYLKWFIYNKPHIDLPYDSNTLSIEFEPQNASDKSNFVYSFKVQGLENSKWSKWSTDGSILLPFLPDGTFTILVQTKDLSLGTNYAQRLLTITITPPFWQTLPFIIFLIILFMFLLFLYVKNRIKKVNQKNEIQNRLIETKMEALQSQMNPHFTFNAMNSIQNYIVKNKMEDALEYLVDFSRLIRQTLDNSLKSSITLAEELLFITLYVNLQNKRYASPVLFKIVTSDAIDKSKVTIPPMIIQPFIENSFIHAFTYDVINPKLELEIVVKDNLTTITIEDNGCGFEIDSIQEHSKGINLVKERIKLYNSDNRNSFEIYSKPHNGTKIIITFLSSFL